MLSPFNNPVPKSSTPLSMLPPGNLFILLPSSPETWDQVWILVSEGLFLITNTLNLFLYLPEISEMCICPLPLAYFAKYDTLKILSKLLWVTWLYFLYWVHSISLYMCTINYLFNLFQTGSEGCWTLLGFPITLVIILEEDMNKDVHISFWLIFLFLKIDPF